MYWIFIQDFWIMLIINLFEALYLLIFIYLIAFLLLTIKLLDRPVHVIAKVCITKGTERRVYSSETTL